MEDKQSSPTQDDPKRKPSETPMKDLVNAATSPTGKRGAGKNKRERR